ncbi:hypothetical protein VDGL01_02591 [Verticillium dahliae]
MIPTPTPAGWYRYNTDGDLITDEVVAKMWPVRVPPSAHSQIDFLSKFAEKPAGVQEEEESQAYEDDDWWQYLSSEEQEQQAQPAAIEDSFQRWLDAPEEEVVSSVEPEPSLEDRLARLTMPSPISVPDVPQGHRSRQALSTSRPAWSILLPSYQMKLDRDAAGGFISRFKDDNADDDGETTGRPWDNDFALDPAARHLPALRQDRLPVRIPSLAALDAHLDAMNIPRSGYRRPRTAPSRSSVSASDKQSTVPSTAPPTTAISKASRIPAPAKKVRTRVSLLVRKREPPILERKKNELTCSKISNAGASAHRVYESITALSPSTRSRIPSCSSPCRLQAPSSRPTGRTAPAAGATLDSGKQPSTA